MTRRCTDSDVDPEWWFEPDLVPSDFGEDRRANMRSLDTAYGRALQKAHQDQARAKLLCYECPFLAECRGESWDESAHVWAGLDASERYSARSKGSVKIGSTYTYKSMRKSLGQREKVVRLFKRGMSVENVAATLGCNTEQIWYHVKGALATARETREEQLWEQVRPPELPAMVSRQGYRLGQLTRSTPLGPDSSSGWDTRTQIPA